MECLPATCPRSGGCEEVERAEDEVMVFLCLGFTFSQGLQLSGLLTPLRRSAPNREASHSYSSGFSRKENSHINFRGSVCLLFMLVDLVIILPKVSSIYYHVHILLPNHEGVTASPHYHHSSRVSCPPICHIT